MATAKSLILTNRIPRQTIQRNVKAEISSAPIQNPFTATASARGYSMRVVKTAVILQQENAKPIQMIMISPQIRRMRMTAILKIVTPLTPAMIMILTTAMPLIPAMTAILKAVIMTTKFLTIPAALTANTNVLTGLHGSAMIHIGTLKKLANTDVIRQQESANLQNALTENTNVVPIIILKVILITATTVFGNTICHVKTAVILLPANAKICAMK